MPLKLFSAGKLGNLCKTTPDTRVLNGAYDESQAMSLGVSGPGSKTFIIKLNKKKDAKVIKHINTDAKNTVLNLNSHSSNKKQIKFKKHFINYCSKRSKKVLNFIHSH